MKVDIKKLPQSAVEIVAELDLAEWGRFVDSVVRELAQETKIEGFRPGHAPRAVVEERLGQSKILEKAADLALRRSYQKIVEEQGLEIISRPEVQVLKLARDNPFEFKIKATVMPEVKLGDYQSLARVDKPKPAAEIKVEEPEVAEALKWLAKSRTQYVTVLRPAQKGDRLEVDFWARKDGQLIEGGESQNHPLTLGEGNFVAGFEDQLVGLKENDEKKFSLIFPTDFLAKDLAGQLVDFEVKIKLVQEPQPPALDDSFARAVGQFDDLAALKKNIGEGLIIEKRQKEKETWRVKVLRSIVEKSTMDLPPVLLEAELEKTLAEFKDSLVQMGLNFEEYLAKIKKTPEELRQNWQPKARERAATALVLDAIARQENIQVSSQEAEEDVNKIISRYPDWDAVKAQIDMEQLLAYAKGRLKNEKVFEWLENFK